MTLQGRAEPLVVASPDLARPAARSGMDRPNTDIR